MRIHFSQITGRRFLAQVAIALLLTTGATIFATTEDASAAVGCYGDYCSGKDPSATGCDRDAYTVAHTYIPSTGARVELRWSPTCKTNWARVNSSWGRAYPTKLSAVQSTGYKQVGVVASNSSYAWTRMIYSPYYGVSARWTGSPGSAATAFA